MEKTHFSAAAASVCSSVCGVDRVFITLWTNIRLGSHQWCQSHTPSLCAQAGTFPIVLFFLQSNYWSIPIDFCHEIGLASFTGGVSRWKDEAGLRRAWKSDGQQQGFGKAPGIAAAWKRAGKAGEMVWMEPGRRLSGRVCSNPPPRAPERHSSPQRGRKKPGQKSNLFFSSSYIRDVVLYERRWLKWDL